MRTLEYVGPHQGEVVVMLATGPARTDGRLIEVDADDAKKLLEQPENWQRPAVEAAVEDAKKKKGA